MFDMYLDRDCKKSHFPLFSSENHKDVSAGGPPNLSVK